MSVGLLIITHGNIGQSIYDAAVTVIGSSPLRSKVVSVPFNQNPDLVVDLLQTHIEELDSHDGVLVLTDMYGATPSNIVCRLNQENVAIVSGLNLPMLIRLMNYPTLSLNELVEKAVSGGQEGIMYCRSIREKHAAQAN